MAVVLAARWPAPIGDQLEPLKGRYYVNAFRPISNNAGQANNFQVIEMQPDAPEVVRLSGFLRKARQAPATYHRHKIIAAPYPDVGETFWFDRLHVLPQTAQTVDLGNLVNDVDTTFEVMNTHRLIDATIAEIERENAEGFTVLSGATPPSPGLVIRAYTSELYTIRAGSEFGPPTIDAVFRWVPANAPFAAVEINFTGNRITICVFEPQVEPLTRFEFLTNVAIARDGSERRASMRPLARESIGYRFVFGGDDDPYGYRPQAFEHMMLDSLGRTFAVPVWEDRTVLTAAVSGGATVVNVPATANLDFRVGELLVLWRAWNNVEAQEILSIAATSITVASPFINAFAVAGTVVLPSWYGHLDDNVQQEVFRFNFTRWGLRFHRQNNVSFEVSTSPTLAKTYEGLPIFPKPWGMPGNSITRTWQRAIEETSAPLGPPARAYKWTVPRRKNSAIVVEMAGRTDFLALRSFLYALRGKQKTFWLPSGYQNFILTTTASSGAGLIRVRRNFYPTFVAERQPFNKIQVTLTTGAVFRHTIVDSANVNQDETDLTITPTLSTDYTVANVAKIEYITKHRLDSDVLEFQGRRPQDDYTVVLPLIEVLE